MIAFIVFLFPLAFYLLHQSRALYGGDSSEYSLVANSWSIPHAPGYPLYSLLLNVLRNVFFFLPDYVTSNFISIAASICTAYFIFKILHYLTKNTISALFSAIFYLFLFPIWLYGEIPEVFALNNLIIVLITWAILRFLHKESKNYRLLIYFSVGVAVAHHHTFVLFIPGWVALLWKKKKSFVFTSPLRNLSFFILGLSFYLYPIVAGLFHPPIDWENARSLDGFIRLVTRASYGTFKAYRDSVPNIINQFTNLFSTVIFLIQDFKPLGLLFIGLGFFSLFSRFTPFSYFFIISFSTYLFFLFVTNFPLSSSFALATYERYLIAFYLLLIFPFGFGISYFLKQYRQFTQKIIRNNTLRTVLSFSSYFFLIGFFLVVLKTNYSRMTVLKNINNFDLFARDLLDTPPKDAVVSFKGDLSYFAASYYYHVKNYRKDLVFAFMSIADRDYYRERLKRDYPSLVVPDGKKISYETFMKQFFLKNRDHHQILFEKPINTGIWVPYGLFWKYYSDKKTAKGDLDAIIQINNNLWSRVYHIPKLSKKERDFLMLDALQNYYLTNLYSYTQLLKSDRRNDEAAKYLKKILEYNPRYPGASESLAELSGSIP